MPNRMYVYYPEEVSSTGVCVIFFAGLVLADLRDRFLHGIKVRLCV